MDLQEFKLENLKIDKNKFGKIYSFVDFGNVNYWYERDERDGDDNILPQDKKLVVDIEKLASFINLFSEHKRFYFGLDPKNPKSIKIISKARQYFNKTVTKPIQRIKHYLDSLEEKNTTRYISQDNKGRYIYIPKCNFDTEICIDAIRFLNDYDTFCLFSSDADFAYLLNFLRRKGKKVILFSAGYITHYLKERADLNINAQRVKKSITFIKTKPRL
ncbi:NYN domain-containing protein [Patescibacteria group bacterium]|nr:NYN domain-containing protein [Patescibacteria group bacterium]MBU4458853.1 NYN domain-containing protein [Patescibacteria group bacterium]MCG2696138.1 NYN domain-containing protein [Candidatus Portnoybacteria bacterium]